MTLSEQLRQLADKIDKGWPLLAVDAKYREYEDGEIECELAITDQGEQPRTLLFHAEAEDDYAQDHCHSIVAARNESPPLLRQAAEELDRRSSPSLEPLREANEDFIEDLTDGLQALCDEGTPGARRWAEKMLDRLSSPTVGVPWRSMDDFPEGEQRYVVVALVSRLTGEPFVSRAWAYVHPSNKIARAYAWMEDLPLPPPPSDKSASPPVSTERDEEVG